MAEHRREVIYIMFCGYSAGAVCCIAALDFFERNPDADLEMVKFGSPRLCNGEYGNIFDTYTFQEAPTPSLSSSDTTKDGKFLHPKGCLSTSYGADVLENIAFHS